MAPEANPALCAVTAALGLAGGILSGLLGIGGGILLAPLLLYVPPAVGQPALDMQVVAGLTIVQSLFAGLSGAVAHRGLGNVDAALALWLGGAMAVTSFAGAWWSRSLSPRTLLAIFVVLAVVAAASMAARPPAAAVDEHGGVVVRKGPALAAGAVIGFFGGMVGQSGAFLVLPAMVRVLKVPLRTAIGTTLAVVVLAALAGTAGKLLGEQVHVPLAAALVPAGVIGARVGASWSARVEVGTLRRALTWILAATALRMSADLFTG